MRKVLVCAVVGLSVALSFAYAKGKAGKSTTTRWKVREMEGSSVQGTVVICTNMEASTVIVLKEGEVYKAMERPGKSRYSIGHHYKFKVHAGTKTWPVVADGRSFTVPLMEWDGTPESQ